MKNKVRDILADKKVKLQELTAQAEAAVDLVTKTISGLELVNQKSASSLIATCNDANSNFLTYIWVISYMRRVK